MTELPGVRLRDQNEPQRKLNTVLVALQHSFPTAEIEQMLSEIEQGYTVDLH